MQAACKPGPKSEELVFIRQVYHSILFTSDFKKNKFHPNDDSSQIIITRQGICYVSSTTDVFNLNFPRVLRNGFCGYVWHTLLHMCVPDAAVQYRCGPARVWTQGWMPQNTFPCVSVYTVAGECWKKLLNNKYPLLNALSIPSRWPRSTDGARAFDEHTLCINLDCRKRSFQVFDDLHLPVILCNNFSIYLSLIPPLLLPNEATSSSELRLVVGARYLTSLFSMSAYLAWFWVVPCTSRLAVVVLVVMF